MKRIFTLLYAVLVFSTAGLAQQVTGLTFAPVGGSATSLKISWTSGTGVGRIIVVKDAAGVFDVATISNNTTNIATLGANSDYSAATDKDGGTGVVKIVAAISGAGTNVTVTNLVAGTTYYVQAYEFTNTAANPTYNLTTSATNPKGVVFYTATGSFTVPNDITTVSVQAWGGGGGGGRDSGAGNGAAGGGGGAFASGTATVAFGVNPTVTVGAGGLGGINGSADGTVGTSSSFGAVVIALGGGVTNTGATGAAGGSGAGSTGNGTKNNGGSGGNGGVATGNGGGGGGSSGSVSGAGVNGGNFSGGTGGAIGDGPDGDGGIGGNASGQTATAGTFPGGGGGGRGDGNGNSGAGADGLVIVTFSDQIAPVFTLTAPASSSFVANTNVSYTLSEPITSGTITWTHTGGAADGNHIQALTGAELNAGAHTSITLTNNPTLVDGAVYTVSFNGIDASNNAATTVNSTLVTYDVSSPAAFTVGATASTGGTVVSGFYNSTNTGITVDVPIANDASLNGGTVQLLIDNQAAGGFINLGSTSAISSVNTTKTVTISSATLTGSSRYADGNTLSFKAIITDAAGNQTMGTVSVSTLVVDVSGPAAFTAGTVSTNAGGTVVAGYYNISNHTNTAGITVAVPVANDAGLSSGTIQIQVSNNGSGGTYINLGSAVAVSAINTTQNVAITDAVLIANAKYGDGNALNFKAIITDNAGNPTTSSASASSLIIDQTAPAAFTVGTNTTNVGGTVVNGYYNLTNVANTAGITVNVPIANDATLNGGSVQVTVDNQTAGGFVNLGSSSAIAAINTTKGVNITDASLTGSVKYGDGNTLSFKALITDVAGNPTTGTTSASTCIIDLTAPGAFTVGSTASTGGTVISGFYNSTNTGITVDVPIANDASLSGGTVQLQIDNQAAGGFINLGSTSAIAAISATKTVAISSATLTGNGRYANGNTLSFKAIISDVAGNATTGTVSASTLIADTSAPSAFTAGTVSTNTGGTVVAGYYNISNQANTAGITVAVPVANDASLSSGTIQIQVSNNGSGGTYINLGTAVAVSAINTTQNVVISDAVLTANAKYGNGNTLNFKAVLTDNASNTTTSSASASTLIIDQTAPAALTVGSLTTTGGTVVAAYWNSSNTGINVVVPLTAGDGTLDGGTVQIQVQNTTTNVWVNVASSGLSTITNGQRTGGTKTVAITAADLEAAVSGADGFKEGLVGGASGSETQFLQVRAIVSDAAGNGTNWTKSATNIDVDQTPPSVTAASFSASFVRTSDPSFTTCNGTAIAAGSGGDSNKEMVHLTISEPLNLADGTTIPVVPTGGLGFNSSTGSFSTCSNRGGTAYHPTNIIHLKSNNDGDWTSATTYSFTPGGTVVKDAAGNEMGTFAGLSPADTDPPDLATGLVFNANGSGPETITFKFDGPLNAAVTNTVTGFTTSAGTIAGGANYNSASQTVTLTSTANGMWTDAVTLSYNQATGNVTDAANNELVAFGGAAPAPAEPIFLTSVHIQSNNGTNTAFATTGNTITLTFNVARALASTPTVTFYGATPATTVTGPVGSTYTATLLMTGAMAESGVPFSIVADETIKSTTTTATTDSPNGSTVTFDKTAPTVTPITIASNNANPVYAKVGDVVTVSYTATDNLGTISVSPATIDGLAASTVTATAATLTTTASDNNGVIPFSITFTDQAGNSSVKTATTNASTVTFDKAPPVVASIAISSTLKGIGTTNGIVACPTCGNTSVSFLVTFTETNTPLTGIDPNDFTVGTTGTVIFSSPVVIAVTSATTRTVTINGINGYGKISLGLTDDNTILDAASNPLAGAADGSIPTSFTGTQYYTIVMPEPGAQPFSLTSSGITQTSITINWSSPNADTPLPTHYLVMATPTSVNSYPSVNDGIFVSNATFVQNIPRSGVSLSATFNGLNSGTSYNFTAYKYTLAPNNTNDNIDFELTSQAILPNVVTNTATASWAVQNSTAVPIPSITDNIIGGKANVLNFTIYDDGQNPISPNIMTLNDNGASPETITFNLQGPLTNTTGSSLNGFSSSSGTVASAIYNGGTSVTLTNAVNNTWDQNTTISYSPTTGNVKFSLLGIMEPIVAHAITPAVGSVLTYNSPGSFSYTIPAGVTSITVEAWGAGGSGGNYEATIYGGASQGGGGGAYSSSTIAVNPGDVYSIAVGQGGASNPIGGACCIPGTSGGSSAFGSSVVASGGEGGESAAYFAYYGTAYDGSFSFGRFGRGGLASNGTGTIKNSGGNGGHGGGNDGSNYAPSGFNPNYPSGFPMLGDLGGSGGSSAGTASDGFNGPNGFTGAICCFFGYTSAPAGGGQGGSAYNSSSAPGAALRDGVFPGGGGGGSNGISGAGANGQLKITVNAIAPSSSNTWARDDSPFKFNKVVFTPAAGNSSAAFGNDWRNIIAGAELSDGTNSVTINSSTGVNATDLTFSGIPASNSSDVGYITDANGGLSSKTYTLRVWLRNDLSNSLAQTVDGLNLAFAFDPSTNLTYEDITNSNEKSSRLNSPLPSMSSGSCQIQVAASQLVYKTPGNAPTNTNPQNTIGVGTPFSANIAGQDPEVYALDANNNLDLGYNNSANITNPLQGFGQSIGSSSFSNGKLSLNPFFFNTGSATLANTQIVVTGTGAPAVTAATSTNVWPVISSLTTISAGIAPGSELAGFPSTTNSLPAAFNFDFVVTDDVAADGIGFTNNDALPTIIQTVTITQDPNNGTNGGGDVATFDDWTKTIAGAQLLDVSTSSFVNASSITGSTLVFNLPAAMQTVPDGGSQTYQLRIWLKNPVDPTLVDILDNKDFAFSINDTNLSPLGASNTTSIMTASGTNTGDGRNVVTVTASQLDFVTQWLSGANQNYDAPLDADAVTVGVQSPAGKARDANGNLDLDFNAAVTVATQSPVLLPVANAAVGVSNGLLSFDPLLQVTSAGGGPDPGNTKLVLTSGALTGTSNSINLHYSNASDIIRDNTFTYPTNILYASANNQVSDITAGTGVAMEQFTLRDGGASNDADGSPTQLTAVTINVTNWQNLRRLALYNGATEVKDVDVATTINTITGDLTFNAFATTFITPDNNNPSASNLTIKASFKANGVVDNQVVTFRIVSVTASAVSSSQFGTTTPVGIQSSVSGNQNKIEVVATQIAYTTLPPGPTASLNVPFAVTVQAQDAFSNLDADYNGTISSFTTSPGGPTFITANNPSGSFVGGVLNFPYTVGPPATGFQFTTGNGNAQLVLNSGAASTAGASIDAGAIAGTSVAISVLTSFDSWLYFDPTFAYTDQIDFVPFQNSPTTNASQALGRIILSDGGAPGSIVSPGNPSPGTKNQLLGSHNDVDGAPTAITDFTVSLTNFGDIKKIGLYTLGGTQIGADQTPAASVTFSSLSGFPAPDDDVIAYVIRAEFNSAIVDQTQITMQITAVTHNSGSNFPTNGTIAGIAGGDAPTAGHNFLNVIATSLDFMPQASAYAGINEPVGPTFTTAPLPTTSAAVVNARDKFQNLDNGAGANGFNVPASSITITDIAGDNIASPAAFVNGVLNLNGLIYNIAGNGTLKVVAGGIDSSNPPVANTSAIPGGLVNVVNVVATLQTNGVLSTPNIKGGSTNNTIFGVTFTPDYQTATEPSLKKFIITFDHPFQTTFGGKTTDIFKNFKVLRSLTGSAGSSVDVNTLGITYPLPYAKSPATIAAELPTGANFGHNDFDQLIIDFGSSPLPFRNASNQPASLSFFLVADVDVTASIATPSLTPQILDGGYGSPDDANIVTTKGTAYAFDIVNNAKGAVVGTKYQFASTRPPALQASLSNPFSGQLNVDPGLSQIDLAFDVPVWSLDGTAKLYDRSTNVQVANLVAINGDYNNYLANPAAFPLGPPIAISPISFSISFLPDPASPGNNYKFQPNSVYYLTIAQGSLNGSVGTGLSDNGFNFYGGITSNSIYYFKISNPNPPVLSFTKTLFSNSTTAAFQTTFDQLGTSYYLVLDHATYVSQGNGAGNTPTYTDIINPTTYMASHPGAVIYNSNYAINQVSTPQTVTFSAPLSISSAYDVWIFARNDAQPIPFPKPGPTSLPYLSAASNYSTTTGTGPTFQIPTSPGKNIYSPDYTICPNSFVTLTDPIIIGELNNTDFSSAAPQDFYLYLPTGYEFDPKNLPTVQLSGSDFIDNVPSIDLINNTLLHINGFTNTTQAIPSLDNIIITNLRVIGLSGSGSGSIQIFAGTNKLSSVLNFGGINSSASVATIGLFTFTPPQFVNTYSTENTFPSPIFSPASVVTYIPDNYVDTDPVLANLGAVRLVAKIVASNDYNASFFTGNGVTNDQLTLGAVVPNAAFDITMNHTDPNGCIAQVSNQYLVYDHKRPISNKLGTAPPPQRGIAQTLVNPNFGKGTGIAPAIPSATFAFDELTGYRLISLVADIPASVKNGQTTQIIQDAGTSLAWATQVAKIPFSVKTTNSASSPTGKYFDYKWDYSNILNAKTQGSVALDPYDNFKVSGQTLAKNDFWKGGSLGNVQFTGSFQSSADFSVLVPFRQNVELFIPAIPIIEVVSGNNPSTDAADVTKNTLNGLTPAQNIFGLLYPNNGNVFPGTPVFCEAGGTIVLNAYPAASANSTGTFAIYDYQSYNFSTNTGAVLLTSAPNTPFVDNGNGSMTLDPSLVKNGYNDILVTYTYQENNSPAIGTGYIVIRVTPNPVAQFTIASTVANPGASTFDAFCSTSLISFDAKSVSSIATSSQGTINSINNYTWDFGDPNSGLPNSPATPNVNPTLQPNPGGAGGQTIASAYIQTGTPAGQTYDKPVHIYNVSTVYPVSLSLTSNWGCPSLQVPIVNPLKQTNNVLYSGSNGTIKVGDKPTVDFSFTGNCVGDAMIFTDKSKTPGQATSGTVAKFDWQFGDSAPTVIDYTGYNTSLTPSLPDGRNNVSHTYATPNFYLVTLTTTTDLGCQASLPQSVAQLPWQKLPLGSAYNELFDTNGGWLPLSFSGSTPTDGRSTSATPTSWFYDASLGKWTIPGTYAKGEKSALYSACIDLSSIARPLIQMNTFVDLTDGEGLVLQYSKDSKNIQDKDKVWDVLGTTSAATTNPSPGLDWYSGSGLSSNPGTNPGPTYSNSNNSSGYGWSKFQVGHLKPKHKLEDIKTGALPNDRVILRFAFASSNAGGKGVTLDSVHVGSRTRTILFENFTSTDAGTNNADVLADATAITTFVQANLSSTQLVNINYHVGFIGMDPFNLDNPADPSSRALYYNVNKVPYAFLDGKHYQDNGKNPPSDLFKDWGQGEYDLNTLQLAKADFLDATTLGAKLTAVSANPDGSLQVDVNFTPVFDLPFGVRGGTMLQVAILEKSITSIPSNGKVTTGETSFGYVLKKMLPNASGTKFTNPIKAGVPVSAGSFKWIPDKAILHNSPLTVVVFLQNEDTKEVYQAFIQDDVAPPPVVTAIEPIIADNIKVYPNPADQEFTIELPSPAHESMRVTMANQLGQFTEVGAIGEGEQSKRISTQGLTEGVYILQLGSNGNALRTKVVVLHK